MIVPYDHALSGEAAHRAAAEKLKAKMGWKGELCGGGIKNGYAFVFAAGCERSES